MSHYASTPNLFPLHGGCACGHVRYTLAAAPLVVHACHCPLCQRESGSAFVLNAVVETDTLLPAPSAPPTHPATAAPLGPPLACSPFGAPAADADTHASAAPATVAVTTPTASRAGQTIHRCPRCAVALWSFYGAGAGPFAYLRVATLDRAAEVDPDAHIFVKSKRAFVALADGTPQFPGHYQPADVYRAEAMERLQAVMRKMAGEGQ